MNIHKNARLTPLRREEMALSVIEGGLSKAHAARMHGVSPKIVARWVERYRAEGRAGMFDRSSRPYVTPGMTRQDVAERIVALRRQRLTGRHIAVAVGVSPATVSRVLRRAGLSRLRDLEPAEPVRRYVHETPGDMIHIDIKKLGRFERVGHRITGDPQQGKSRGAGWEFVHVSIDDASRIAFSQILPNEKQESAVAFLKAGGRLLHKPRRRDRARHDRQRIMLQVESFRPSMPRPRPQACQDQALHAQDQRQGGALHPDGATGMGLRHRLPNFRPTRRRAARLDAPIQLASPTRRYKLQDANQSPRQNRGQPVEAPQLGTWRSEQDQLADLRKKIAWC